MSGFIYVALFIRSRNFEPIKLHQLKFQNDFQELVIGNTPPIIIRNIEYILFVYYGDNKYENRKNRRILTGESNFDRLHFDHIKMDRKEVFFDISSEEDKVDLFNFINQMHFFNRRTKLIIGRDEIPLPVDPNQKFFLNDNHQLITNELDH